MLWDFKITGPCKAAACWKVGKCGCREEYVVKVEAGVWWRFYFEAGGDVQGHGIKQGHQHCIQTGRTQAAGSGLVFVVGKAALGLFFVSTFDLPVPFIIL